jgi:hypothetical protein
MFKSWKSYEEIHRDRNMGPACESPWYLKQVTKIQDSLCHPLFTIFRVAIERPACSSVTLFMHKYLVAGCLHRSDVYAPDAFGNHAGQFVWYGTDLFGHVSGLDGTLGRVPP